MPKQTHSIFSKEYSSLVSELITEIKLFNPIDINTSINTIALWDTGAVISCIAPSVLKKLNLNPIDSITIEVVNSTERCDLVLVQVGLPNGLILPNIKPAVCNFSPPDVEFIIGMDIIKLGDFIISNSLQKTLFSFITPPLAKRIDFKEV